MPPVLWIVTAAETFLAYASLRLLGLEHCPLLVIAGFKFPKTTNWKTTTTTSWSSPFFFNSNMHCFTQGASFKSGNCRTFPELFITAFCSWVLLYNVHDNAKCCLQRCANFPKPSCSCAWTKICACCLEQIIDMQPYQYKNKPAFLVPN